MPLRHNLVRRSSIFYDDDPVLLSLFCSLLIDCEIVTTTKSLLLWLRHLSLFICNVFYPFLLPELMCAGEIPVSGPIPRL